MTKVGSAVQASKQLHQALIITRETLKSNELEIRHFNNFLSESTFIKKYLAEVVPIVKISFQNSRDEK